MFSKQIMTRQFIGVLVANFCYWFSLDLFLPVLPQYYYGMGFSEYQVGMVVGGISVGGLLFRFVAGKLVDRYGSALLVGLGFVFGTMAALGFGWAKTVPTATAFAILQGLGLACYSGAALTMATLMFSEEFTAEVFAAYSLLGMVGGTASMASANWLYQQLGIMGIVFLSAGLAIVGFISFPKRPQLTARMVQAHSLSTREIAVNPGVYIPTVSLLATSLCFSGAMTFLPLMMLQRGLNDFNAFFATYSCTMVIVRLMVRKLFVWFSPRAMTGYSIFFCGLAMWVAALSYSWWQLSLCGVLLGISFGMSFPAMGTLVTVATAPVNRGTAFGIFTTASDIGFVAGATGLGFLAAWLGYGPVFWVAGAYSLLYVVLYNLFLKKKLVEEVSALPETSI